MPNRVSLNVLNRAHWERPGDAERLGCAQCIDRADCGGIRPGVEVFSCRDFCCGKPETCTRVCDLRVEDFVDRRREVRGWALDNIPRFDAGAAPTVPEVIPELFHTSGRTATLRVSAIAAPLRALITRSGTLARFSTKGALLRNLRASSRAALIIDGIGRDCFIETFWAERHASGLLDAVARLRPAWVITPNYSVLTNVPRWENLHAMKRIAIVWAEFMERGVPAALTINARTDRDWERWTEFVLARPEVQAVALELGTGGRYADRRAFMLPRLRELGLAAGGRLRLFVRGGRAQRGLLSDAFAPVHLIDTNPFMKAVHRQRVVNEGERVSSKPSFTLVGQPIEDLLRSNVEASR